MTSINNFSNEINEAEIDKFIREKKLKKLFENYESLEAMRIGIQLIEIWNQNNFKFHTNYIKGMHEIISYTIKKFNKENNSIENIIFWSYYLMLINNKYKSDEKENFQFFNKKENWFTMFIFIVKKILNNNYLLLLFYNTNLSKLIEGLDIKFGKLEEKHTLEDYINKISKINEIENKIINDYRLKLEQDLEYLESAKTQQKLFPITKNMLENLLNLFEKSISD